MKKTNRPSQLLSTVCRELCLGQLVVGVCILGCTAPKAPDRSTVEESVAPSEPGSDAIHDTVPARALAPAHVAELRRLAHAGAEMMAMGKVDELLVEYPEDPWVLADSGFAILRSDEDKGVALLQRAFELATEPSLRAEILYYQAIHAQRKLGFVGGREAVAAVLAEYPLPVAARNLELIDGPSSSSPEDEEAVRATCRRALQSNIDFADNEHRKCAAVRVGHTLWAYHVRVMGGLYARNVIHEWYFVDPRFPEGLKMYGDDGPEHDPDEAECRNYEVLAIDAPYGIEGGIAHTEFVTRGPRESLLFRCTTGNVRMKQLGVTVAGPSSYMRVCELDTGWCNRPTYTREVLFDGTVREATVQIVDEFIVVTPTDGGAPRRISL
jgi:hypothetical protein